MMRKILAWILGCAGLAGCSDTPDIQQPLVPVSEAVPSRAEGTVRVATFNVAFFRDEPGALIADLELGNHPRAEAIRAIINSVDPDILVINEIDYDEEGRAINLFANALGTDYDFRLALPSNTGVASWTDLDNDGRSDHAPGTGNYGNDSFGYGQFPGQYAFAVISRYPIDEAAVRTFQKLLWRDLPNNLMPTDFYSDDAQEVFRLSSKNHAVVPINVGENTLHMVLAHPTPPGFDGPEDRNGRRNNDEIRLLMEMVAAPDANWLVDDAGQQGGLPPGSAFVLAGDL
ncbi:MAG: endonuclease/exonuclease/phosphatase family protein, partial [Pseudomonadota bacterium]